MYIPRVSHRRRQSMDLTVASWQQGKGVTFTQKVELLLLKRSRHLECYPRFSDYRTSHCSLRCNATVPFLHDNLSVEPCSAPVTPNSSMGFPSLRSNALPTFVASSTNYYPVKYNPAESTVHETRTHATLSIRFSSVFV